MPCCGQNRNNDRASYYANPSRAPSVAPMKTPIRLRHLGANSIVVRGPAKGQVYTFTSINPICAVDSRDSEALLRTRLFRRET